MPKVTRKGGGAALPWRRRLFAPTRAGRGGRRAPAGVPVTVKMRKGIDDDHLTYVEAGLIAQEAGVAAVALHGRTAAQRYSGTADWDAIATLKQALDVPVLGNGDIWEADDALRMVAHTGVDGVVVGRGCLGRPWLFADLEAAFDGRSERRLPTLGEVAVTMRRHAELLVDQFTAGARNPARGERDGCTDFRKHVAWYLKGFPVGGELRRALAMIESLAQLDDLLGKLDPAEPFPVAALGPAARADQLARQGLPAGGLAGQPGRRHRPRGRRDGRLRRLSPRRSSRDAPRTALRERDLAAGGWHRSSAPCRADVVNESPLGSTRLGRALPGPDSFTTSAPKDP